MTRNVLRYTKHCNDYWPFSDDAVFQYFLSELSAEKRKALGKATFYGRAARRLHPVIEPDYY